MSKEQQLPDGTAGTKLYQESPSPIDVLGKWHNTYIDASGNLVVPLSSANKLTFVDLSGETTAVAALGALLISAGYMAAS